MSATADSGDGSEGAAGWDVDPDNDSVALVEALGRQLRMWREAAGLRAAEFGARVGYGENQVYKLESGRRIPRPEFLVKADEVLGAGGKIAAMADDVAQARYPKRVRELAKLEARAVELALYSNHKTSMGCCRRRSLLERYFGPGDLRCRRTNWSGPWLHAWRASRSMSVRWALR